MKRRLAALATTTLLAVGALGASPALAATDSDSITCGNGSTIGVRGEQQRLHKLSVSANGSLLGSTTSALVIKKVSNATSGSWSATSESFLYSGSYGWCNPDISL